MRDFNFFAAYIKRKEKNRTRAVLLTAVAALVLFTGFCAFTVYAVFEYRMSSIRYQIDANNIYLKDKGTAESLQKLSALSEQFVDITLYNTMLKHLSVQIVENSLIKTDLIKSIADNLPKDMSIGTMSISANSIGLTGVSESEVSIADFQRTMSGLSFVGNVYVASITGQEPGLMFTMSIRIKDVATDVGNE